MKLILSISLFTMLFIGNENEKYNELGDCPDGTESVSWSCGGFNCVGFPRAWSQSRKDSWKTAADNIRCAPDVRKPTFILATER